MRLPSDAEYLPETIRFFIPVYTPFWIGTSFTSNTVRDSSDCSICSSALRLYHILAPSLKACLKYQGRHLPATLLASFVKRLARLSLNASPSAIIMVIPFTYNILKRHPALMVMIHRSGEDDQDASCGEMDSSHHTQYNPDTCSLQINSFQTNPTRTSPTLLSLLYGNSTLTGITTILRYLPWREFLRRRLPSQLTRWKTFWITHMTPCVFVFGTRVPP